jgi:fatty-acyl-CoA synthase
MAQHRDLGREDADGYFWLTGRRKELIIRGGHNIDPKMIEEALQAHPAVAMAAAIGSPDAYSGEVPVAYVQTKPGASVTEEELLEFAAAHVPERAAVPKRVRITAALPVTRVGKIFKPDLQKREIEIVIRLEAEAASASLAGLEVDQDPSAGFIARVRVASGRDRLRLALQRYAFKFEIAE